MRALEWLDRAGARALVIWGAAADPLPVRCRVAELDAVAGADAILDVTHAFDTATRAAARHAAPSLPYGRLGRAPWVPMARDRWTEVDTLAQAIAALPSGARVFAATGRGSLAALAGHDGPVFLRQLTRHDLPMPLPRVRFVFGTAPFSVADEVALFRDLAIGVVLARNIGGAGSFPKLAAARQLGVPVVLLRPPAVPQGPQLASFDDVATWIGTL
jgi:precorrin-6A/cobalt-precorrin-6A reductase